MKCLLRNRESSIGCLVAGLDHGRICAGLYLDKDAVNLSPGDSQSGRGDDSVCCCEGIRIIHPQKDGSVDSGACRIEPACNGIGMTLLGDL